MSVEEKLMLRSAVPGSGPTPALSLDTITDFVATSKTFNNFADLDYFYIRRFEGHQGEGSAQVQIVIFVTVDIFYSVYKVKNSALELLLSLQVEKCDLKSRPDKGMIEFLYKEKGLLWDSKKSLSVYFNIKELYLMVNFDAALQKLIAENSSQSEVKAKAAEHQKRLEQSQVNLKAMFPVETKFDESVMPARKISEASPKKQPDPAISGNHEEPDSKQGSHVLDGLKEPTAAKQEPQQPNPADAATDEKNYAPSMGKISIISHASQADSVFRSDLINEMAKHEQDGELSHKSSNASAAPELRSSKLSDKSDNAKEQEKPIPEESHSDKKDHKPDE